MPGKVRCLLNPILAWVARVIRFSDICLESRLFLLTLRHINLHHCVQYTCHGIVAIRAWFAFGQVLRIVHAEGWKYLHWAPFPLLPEPRRLGVISLLFFVNVDPPETPSTPRALRGRGEKKKLRLETRQPGVTQHDFLCVAPSGEIVSNVSFAALSSASAVRLPPSQGKRGTVPQPLTPYVPTQVRAPQAGTGKLPRAWVVSRAKFLYFSGTCTNRCPTIGYRLCCQWRNESTGGRAQAIE